MGCVLMTLIRIRIEGRRWLMDHNMSVMSAAAHAFRKFVIDKGRVITSLACGGHLMSDRDSSNSFLWFLAGLGFGALLGVLYAPRSGRETRDAIKSSAQEGG